MLSLKSILALAALFLGIAVASRRGGEPRLRLAAGCLAAVALVVILLGRLSCSDDVVNRYETANRRQGYVLGFGLGQYLKANRPGQQLVLLRDAQESSRDRETIKGFKAALKGALKIVADRQVDTSAVTDYQTAAALWTTDLLRELRDTGADIVVSFLGLPMRVDETGQCDQQLTMKLWRTPEFRALQWVLPAPQVPLPPEELMYGHVLAIALEKPQAGTSKQFPAYLESQGTPAELFAAWFELITTNPEP